MGRASLLWVSLVIYLHELEDLFCVGRAPLPRVPLVIYSHQLGIRFVGDEIPCCGFPCHLFTLVGGSVLRGTRSLAAGFLVVYLH